MEQLSEMITIPQFFSGKSIFITGGTGFIGKALIEKLLRSCPECGPIYLLLRPKKGKDVRERLEKMLNGPLFEKLKMEKPETFSKLNIIEGDTILENLGLSLHDKTVLEENISIIFHIAASVRFDDSLKYALKVNVRGTHEVVKLALNMKNLKVFMHVSTTYCNSDRHVVDEIIYPPHGDWRDSIKMIDLIDDDALELLSPKIIGSSKLVNTYVYAKSLAEQLIKDYANEIPFIIFRPSIVVPSHSDPYPGYVDNFNGPAGLIVGIGLGVLHCLLSKPDVKPDYVPVDMLVRGMLISTWLKATEKSSSENPTVYNASSHDIQAVSTQELVDVGLVLAHDISLRNAIWFPSVFITPSKVVHYISVIFLHLLPAIIIDTALKITGRKPRLIKIQRKIYMSNVALKPFMFRQFSFINEKIKKFKSQVLQQDHEDFGLDFAEINVSDYFRNALLAGSKYLLHQDPMNPKNKTYKKRLYILDRITRGIFFLLLFYLVVFPGLQYIYHTFTSYFFTLLNY